MYILGISAFYHDSAAALVKDGVIIAAAQEERFTRKKHDSNYPRHAIEFCVKQAGILPSDIDYVVFFEKPFIKFERLMETYLAYAPRGFSSFRKAIPVWLREKLFQKKLLIEELNNLDAHTPWSERLLFSEHHLSHAASAFYPSPFEEAVILTMDGVGEWATGTVAIGRGREIEIKKEIHFPHSLGLLYSAFTYYCGFKVNSGEYKLMGLAPYGEPRFAGLIKDHLIDIKEDGSFHLDMKYFNYCTGLTMTNAKFAKLFGMKARKADELLTQTHMDIAASIQAVLEEVVLKLTRALRKEYGIENLVMAGGVALNCVANGKILRDGAFKNIWVQPAAGDAGGALGAALAAYHLHCERSRNVGGDRMQGSYLGPDFSDEEIEARLKNAGAVYVRLDTSTMMNHVVRALEEGKAVGWFQGRMEFGPRALGARSILGDPRSPAMQKTLNLRVKYRESFRPFAPAVLAEDVSQWFEYEGESPYMLMVANVTKDKCKVMSEAEEKLFGIDKLNIPRSEIPAVTHVDYSARIQTVDKKTNALFHQLISAFKEKTGCGVLVNTSFNVRGEPIVCTPEDAFRCFMGSEIEMLALGNCVLYKELQDPSLKLDYTSAFELD